MKKAIVIGPPFCGKTTLVNLLRKNYPNFVIKELDELLIENNGGTWPANEPYRNGVLLPTVVNQVLAETSEFIFFTSYISPENIQRATKARFTIIQLVCPREILITRNIKNDLSRQKEMERNLEYQTELKKNCLVNYTLDCNRVPEEIITELISLLA